MDSIKSQNKGEVQMGWFILIVGLYNIALALLIKTKGTKEFLVFKVIPFSLGIVCIYSGFTLLNI